MFEVGRFEMGVPCSRIAFGRNVSSVNSESVHDKNVRTDKARGTTMIAYLR